MTLSRRQIVLLSSLCLSVSNLALARELAEQVVVTGSYTPQEFDAMSSNVTIISREQIKASGKSSALDLLRSVPGLSVKQNGGAAGVSEVYIRGSESNFILVLIDGVKVNDSSNTRGGGFNFNSLDPNQIEKIEILRGVQTAIYGGEALAGVINIVTKPATQKGVSQNAAVSLSEQGYYTANYGLQLANSQFSADINLSAMDSGNDLPFNQYDNTQVAGGFFWSVNDMNAVGWRFRSLDDTRLYLPEQSGGDRLSSSFDLESTEGKEVSHTLFWQVKPNDFWQSKIELDYFDREFQQDSPGVVPFDAVPPNAADTDYSNSEVLWVNTLGSENSLWVNVGASTQSESGESIGNVAGFLDTSFKMDRDSHAVFVEGHYKSPSSVYSKASVRYDDPDNLDSEMSYSASISVPMGNMFSLSSSWGKGFKLPSFFALGHPLVGNSALKPERAETLDIRLKMMPNDDTLLSIAYFNNQFKDLIDFDPDLFTNINRSVVDIDGIELAASWAASENLQLNAHISTLNIDTHDDTAKLSGRPEEQFGIDLNWTFAPAHSLFVAVRHNGDRFDTSLYTGQTMREVLKAYTLVDLNYNWMINSNVDVSVAIDNVFNKTFEEAIGFSSLDRTARLQAQLSF